MISAPIPGQSLTTPPKNFPYERPPEITDPEEAIQVHVARLSDPEVIGAALDLIELEELDIHTLTKGIIRSAVSQGIHSIDVGLIVAPIVHEFIKQAAMASGLAAEDGFEDKKAAEQRKQQIASIRAAKMLEKMGAKPKEVVEAEPEIEPEMGMEAPKRGLMARWEMV
jgi:hypothetical protein